MRFPASLPIPTEVVRIAEQLADAGHETWCVGGAVRDNLLNIENKDFDLATPATPEQVRKIFRRTVPVGVEHGTIGVLDQDNQLHEVTTFRKDVRTDGRHAVVEFGVTLEDDLARRDFTINAIAYHPLLHKWYDPVNGNEDLERGVVRAVGDPAQRFREDYLRILRALRFAARFDFEIEGATWTAATENADGLRHLSAERVREEWFAGLEGSRQVSRFVELWASSGAMERWLPEVWQTSRSSEGDGLRREILDALDRFRVRDPGLLTAFLAPDPGAIIRRLKCSRALIRRAELIGQSRDSTPDGKSHLEVRQWMARAIHAVDDLVQIAEAVDPAGGRELAVAVEDIRRSGAALAIGDLAVDGSDLLELGVRPGPDVGRVLVQLLGRVLEEPQLNTQEALRRLARAFAASPDP